jgi:N6-L-threonylcarbamoyladenine synthase
LLAYSQIDDHQKYWGVVPEIASRLHFDKIIEVIKNIGFDAIKKVDFISVTTHPGLPGSLVVGKAVASLLSSYFTKPLVHVNHIYGHLFSLLLDRKPSDIQFPLVVLTASGGHNDIYVVVRWNDETLKWWNDETIEWKEFWWYHIAKVGYTLDDAAGECFDKVARMLGGPYPGWQRISEKALQWKPNNDVEFKRIFLSKDAFEFSFSWMKSQVSFLLKQLELQWIPLTEQMICDIAYEFQEAVVEVMIKKLVRAWIAFGAKTLWLAGGVSCNDRLREYLQSYAQEKLPEVVCLKPMKKVYSMDNAAMIGLAGILEYTNS